MSRAVPFVPQMEAPDCGAAAVAMILGFHGHHAPLDELREACDVSRDGTTAHQMLAAARRYGLEAAAAKVEPDHFADVPLPAILHWDFNHFVVLEALRKRGAAIVDPRQGRALVDWPFLRQHYTGVALLFAPTPALRPRRMRGARLLTGRDLWRGLESSLVYAVLSSLVLQPFGFLLPFVIRVVVDSLARHLQPVRALAIAVALLGAMLARSGLLLSRAWLIDRVRLAVEMRLKDRVVDHLLRLPLDFFLRRHAGDLLTRVTDVGQSASLVSQGIAPALDVLLIAYAVLSLWQLSPRLALVLLPFLVVRAAFFLAERAKRSSLLAGEIAAQTAETSTLVQLFGAAELAAGTGADRRLLMQWSSRMARRARATLARRGMDNRTGSAIAVLYGMASVGVVLLGSHELAAGRLSAGSWAAVLSLQAFLIAPLEGILQSAERLRMSGHQLLRVQDVLSSPVQPTGSAKLREPVGAIEAHELAFRFSDGGAWVLQGVSFCVPLGEWTAFAGRAGAGKTTVLLLLAAARRATAGSILLGGREIGDLETQALRRAVAYLSPQPWFLKGTLLDNLTLFAPQAAAEVLDQALRVSGFDAVLHRLPHGLATGVGEGGLQLSGGERQRLAIARALVAAPSVLLLDEATSSLGIDAELELYDRLRALELTLITVSHRDSVLRRAQRVHVLEAGRLVASGDFGSVQSALGSGQASAR